MKYEFETIAERIARNHSGWSRIKCQTCEDVTTNGQYSYSTRDLKKPLCKACQSYQKFIDQSLKEPRIR